MVAVARGQLGNNTRASGSSTTRSRSRWWAVVAHEELCARYFSGRTDGLIPYTTERLLAAAVPD